MKKNNINRKIETTEETSDINQIDKMSNQKNIDKLADKSVEHDPTRYGDWEKNGRCIDF